MLAVVPAANPSVKGTTIPLEMAACLTYGPDENALD
jgi:hypothetical protein